MYLKGKCLREAYHLCTCVLSVVESVTFTLIRLPRPNPTFPNYLPLLGASLGLQRAGALLHTLPEAHVAVVRGVVQVCKLSQGQDVVAGYS